MNITVLLNLIDFETLDEQEEAASVITQAGGESIAERILLLRGVFGGSPLGRRETLPFARIPSVGEYICLPMEEDTWYRVEIVLHTPAHPAHAAEIFAVEQE